MHDFNKMSTEELYTWWLKQSPTEYYDQEPKRDDALIRVAIICLAFWLAGLTAMAIDLAHGAF